MDIEGIIETSKTPSDWNTQNSMKTLVIQGGAKCLSCQPNRVLSSRCISFKWNGIRKVIPCYTALCKFNKQQKTLKALKNC